MAGGLSNIRILKQLLSCNVKHSHWGNYVLSMQSLICTSSTMLYHPARTRFKIPKKTNTKKQWEPMELKKNVALSEIMQRYNLHRNDIQTITKYLPFNIDNYETFVFRDINQLTQFLTKFGIPIMQQSTEKPKAKTTEKRPEIGKLVKRPPILSVMGHVDHGKTTLLDTLRKTTVAKLEEGGITQKIGVFKVKLGDDKFVTVLDTPGHVAFNTMRERGALVTDIIILVVAADDGVMNQTVDCIKLAQDTDTPIIVAINKIDKPTADIELTKHMLSQYGIVVEELGGNVQSVAISALKGTNLDKLMEAVQLQAEMMDLKGNPEGLVEGFVIETTVHQNLGTLATLLITKGTLKKGKLLLCDKALVKTRLMLNYLGESVPEVSLSEAVQIAGWKDTPTAGEKVIEVKSLKEADQILKERMKLAAATSEPTMEKEEKEEEESEEKFLVDTDNVPEYNVLIKADSTGSMEALIQLLSTYKEHHLCRLSIVDKDVGNVTPSDINLAKIFNATIYCFNTNVPNALEKLIEENAVSVYKSNIIYRIGDHVKEEIQKRFPVVKQEKILGEANILQVFTTFRKQREFYIAGCLCTKGVIQKNNAYHLVRDGEIIDSGSIASLRHEKKNMTEIKKDFECGIKFSNEQLKPEIGDTVVCYKTIEIIPKSKWDIGI